MSLESVGVADLKGQAAEMVGFRGRHRKREVQIWACLSVAGRRVKVEVMDWPPVGCVSRTSKVTYKRLDLRRKAGFGSFRTAGHSGG